LSPADPGAHDDPHGLPWHQSRRAPTKAPSAAVAAFEADEWIGARRRVCDHLQRSDA
jgi:hypothetical protein